MAASILGANKVHITDVDDAMASLRHIVYDLNGLNKESVEVKRLDWTDVDKEWSQVKVDVILAADVVWVEQLIAPLVSAIASTSFFWLYRYLIGC
jgi:hypothetical protein